MAPNENKLDNPVWNSLSETHQNLAIDYKSIKFYHPDYCPFGGFTKTEDTATPIAEYAQLAANFFIIGQKPNISSNLKLNNELVCLQMIIYDKIDFAIKEEIVELNVSHIEDLLGLVKIVYPEYFKKKTADLGSYYGIFKENQLVAVTGERMKMNEFTEVSAVITHPDYAGKGYAKQLVTHAVNSILKQNKIPFLHVAKTNVGAIKLYEKLGFQTRKEISIWNITKKE